MKIIIAGAYAIGTHLARLLSRSNEEITLIDESEERLASIGSDCDLLTMVGKPTSLKILRDAGAGRRRPLHRCHPNGEHQYHCQHPCQEPGCQANGGTRGQSGIHGTAGTGVLQGTGHQQAHLSGDARCRRHQQRTEDELGAPALGCARRSPRDARHQAA